jgi:hypothetical protein
MRRCYDLLNAAARQSMAQGRRADRRPAQAGRRKDSDHVPRRDPPNPWFWVEVAARRLS